MNPAFEKFAEARQLEPLASGGIPWQALAGISTLVAAVVTLLGVLAALRLWRIQARYVQQLDLASEALNLCDEVEDAVNHIRSGNVQNWEHAEREPAEDPNKESELRHFRNAAFAKRKRLDHHKQRFERFYRLRSRFSAFFGDRFDACFDTIYRIHRDLLRAADLFGERLPHVNDPEYEPSSRIEEARKNILFDWGKDDDPIIVRLNPALTAIREACLGATRPMRWRESFKQFWRGG